MVPATANANRMRSREVRFLARAWASKKSNGCGLEARASRRLGMERAECPPSHVTLLHLPGEKRAAALMSTFEFKIDRVLTERLNLHAGDVGDDLNRVRLRASGHRNRDRDL